MATISSFISEISPSMTDIDTVSTSGEKIRTTIQSKIDFVSSSFLTGSYKRRTKISPIDDLDIFFHISAGDTYIEWVNLNLTICKIYIDKNAYDNHPLKDYSVLDNGKYYVSPNKILNHIKTKVEETYSTTSDIGRNGECVTVYLSSYDLTIDCVPCAGVKDKDYYLIPTSGNDLKWKKTNPKKDEDNINELNNSDHFNGKVKGAIKVFKYWNLYKNTGVAFKSYVIECLVYSALKDKTDYTISYIDILKAITQFIYLRTDHKVKDIPGYDYVYFNLSDDQWKRIKGLLEDLREELKGSENDFISYLKE